MGLLNFEKPKKKRSTEEHNEMHMSDSGVAGTYVPNMSDEDRERWKAKHIKGNNERIEIRKTFNGVQLLAIVYKNEPLTYPDWNKFPDTAEGREEHATQRKLYHTRENQIKISMNGSLWLSADEWIELTMAVAEARVLIIESE